MQGFDMLASILRALPRPFSSARVAGSNDRSSDSENCGAIGLKGSFKFLKIVTRAVEVDAKISSGWFSGGLSTD